MTIETAQIKVNFAATLLNALDIGSAQYPLNTGKTNNFANGTSADQANMVFTDERTLSASATEDLDMYGGLTDCFGNTINFATIKAILVIADSGNTNDVQVTRKATNGVPLFMAAGDGVALGPDSLMLLMDPVGFAVTDSSADLLTITNSAGSTGVTYKIAILGTV